MGEPAVVLSHLGGIDEIAMFVVPAAGIILYLRRAERKAQARQDSEEEAPVDGDVNGSPVDR